MTENEEKRQSGRPKTEGDMQCRRPITYSLPKITMRTVSRKVVVEVAPVLAVSAMVIQRHIKVVPPKERIISEEHKYS